MLGQRVKEAREAKGLSQTQLAAGSFSRSYIGAIESGRTKPSAENLSIVAEKLGKPLSYFMPNEQEVLWNKLETMLDQAKSLIAIKELAHAQTIFSDCQSIYGPNLPPQLCGLYLEVSAELEKSNGAIHKSAEVYKTAAVAYISAGLIKAAWKCKYNAAMNLYHANQLSYALFMALEALELLTANEGLSDESRRTHYLIGCCYASLSNISGAQNHFALAEEVGNQNTETGIKALIAKASCYGRQGDWATALLQAQKAAALADQIQLTQLKAEALLGAAVCLVSMQNLTGADRLMAEVISLPQLSTATKRKAYREVILALGELALTTESWPYEQELKSLLSVQDDTVEEWERVKDDWALTKCALLREPTDVKNIALTFSQAFISLMRYRDAVEVLLFGATLLEQQNQLQEALQFTKTACALKDKPQ